MSAPSAPLAAEIRRRLGPPPELRDRPLVSIVVVNRDGVDHLRRLIAGLADRTAYRELEVVAVDNDSSDGSLRFLRTVDAPFPIAIVANARNESFSHANRQGAEVAAGELVLFLNNDTEPFEPGWLHELVACHRESRAGALGATLLYPDPAHAHGYGVQHRGMRFLDEDGLLRADLLDYRADPMDARFGQDIHSPAVTGACLLIERSVYESAGGFAPGYRYGVEDTDLCLAIGARGLPVLASGRSFVIHHPGSTRRKVPSEEQRAAQRRNRILLWRRWGPYLRRQFELDRLEGSELWTYPGREDPSAPPRREQVVAPSVCLMAAGPREGETSHGGDPASVALLEAARDRLEARGRRCLTLAGAEIDDPRALQCDIVVHLRRRHRYVLNPHQVNVLWLLDDARSVTGTERARYERVARIPARATSAAVERAVGDLLELAAPEPSILV